MINAATHGSDESNLGIPFPSLFVFFSLVPSKREIKSRSSFSIVFETVVFVIDAGVTGYHLHYWRLMQIVSLINSTIYSIFGEGIFFEQYLPKILYKRAANIF